MRWQLSDSRGRFWEGAELYHAGDVASKRSGGRRGLQWSAKEQIDRVVAAQHVARSGCFSGQVAWESGVRSSRVGLLAGCGFRAIGHLEAYVCSAPRRKEGLAGPHEREEGGAIGQQGEQDPFGALRRLGELSR